MEKRVPDKFWFPWWPDKWIFGSVRIEFTPIERGIWVDLLSLASKDSGHIRANEETPYPLQQLAGMLIIPEEELDDAINKFIEKGKLTRKETGTLYISKWDKYQFSDRHKRRVEEEMSAKTDMKSEKKDAILYNNKSHNNKSHNNKLNNNTEILALLKKVKNYPFNKEKDLEFIKGLKAEFPDVDILEKVKQITLNWLKFPLKKKSRPRVQIRRWVSNERKWQQEGDKERKVGKSYATSPQSFDLSDFLPMELISQIYQIINSKGGDKDKFYDKAKLAYPKIKIQWEESDKKPETFIRLVEGIG